MPTNALPIELLFQVLRHTDADIIKDLLTFAQFRTNFASYFHRISDTEEPSFWNYNEFPFTNYLESTTLKPNPNVIYLLELEEDSENFGIYSPQRIYFEKRRVSIAVDDLKNSRIIGYIHEESNIFWCRGGNARNLLTASHISFVQGSIVKALWIGNGTFDLSSLRAFDIGHLNLDDSTPYGILSENQKIESLKTLNCSSTLKNSIPHKVWMSLKEITLESSGDNAFSDDDQLIFKNIEFQQLTVLMGSNVSFHRVLFPKLCCLELATTINGIVELIDVQTSLKLKVIKIVSNYDEEGNSHHPPIFQNVNIPNLTEIEISFPYIAGFRKENIHEKEWDEAMRVFQNVSHYKFSECLPPSSIFITLSRLENVKEITIDITQDYPSYFESEFEFLFLKMLTLKTGEECYDYGHYLDAIIAPNLIELYIDCCDFNHRPIECLEAHYPKLEILSLKGLQSYQNSIFGSKYSFRELKNLTIKCLDNTSYNSHRHDETKEKSLQITWDMPKLVTFNYVRKLGSWFDDFKNDLTLDFDHCSVPNLHHMKLESIGISFNLCIKNIPKPVSVIQKVGNIGEICFQGRCNPNVEIIKEVSSSGNKVDSFFLR